MSPIQNTLTLRTGVIANNNTQSVRVLTKKTISIEIESALPLLTIPSTFIEKTKINEKVSEPIVNLATLVNKLVDYEVNESEEKVLVERYIFISTIVSPITGNQMSLYYDKEFKDIILIPNLETIDEGNIVGGAVEFKLKGFAVTVNQSVDHDNEISKYPYTLENNVQLPEANENIVTTTSTCILKGAGGYDNDNGVSRYVSGIEYDSILPVRTPYTNIVKLGAITNFLTATVRLPTYLVYQTSKDRHAISRLGMVDTKTNDLYFELKF